MRTAAIVFMPVLICGIAFSQELAFTSRTYLQSPVVMSSMAESKEFGFDSVLLRNDGVAAVSAVHFKLTFRTGDREELADKRRVSVNLEPRDSRRLVLGLGDVTGLRQLAKSRKQTEALVVLTIESVEFADGSEWRQTEQQGGVPFDPRPGRK